MPTVTLNNATFVYDDIGDPEAQTIIALHGGRGIGDRRGEFNAYRPLSDTYRLIAYDQRGCGQTSLTPPYTFEQLADDVEAFRLTLCGGRKIILEGGSFGGMIALTYALKYGRYLSRLILRGTAASYHHEDDAMVIFKQRLHKASSASVRMLEKMFSDQVLDDTELRLIWLALQPLYYETFDPDAALEQTRTMHLHAQTHNALFQERRYDLRDRLKNISVPTLVICGAQDWICPPQYSRLIVERIPNGQLLEVPDANHAVHIEANDVVVAAIRTFLQATEHP